MSKKLYSFFILLTAFLWLGTGTMWGTTPFTEGFESAVPPTGWSTIHVKGSSWSRVASDYYMTVHGGSYHAKIGYSSSGGDNYLITPQLSPVVGETLKFYIGSTTWGGSTLTVEVSETTNTSASDFTTVLATYHSNVDMNKTWGDAKEISLSAYAGKNIYIAFHMVDNNGDNVYIDDLSIEAPVTCPKTGTPEASSVGQNTATISWAEGGSETVWNLRYKSASASDWTVVEGLTTKSHNLTGLTAGKTTYNYEVQADCGGGDASDWNAGTPFQTECGAISVATEDWKDGFEGYTAGFSTTDPGCWHIIGANAGQYAYPRIHVTNKSSNSSYVRTGNNSLFVVSSSSADSYIIFPEFDTPLNTLQVAFSHKGEANYYSTIQSSKLTLGYVTDINDATTFHALREEFTRSTSWTEEEESLAGIPAADLATARLAFKVGASEANNYNTGIDDITISALPSCTKPTLNDATDQTFEGATFTWDGSATQYQYAVVASGASVETWSDATNAKTYTVTGKAAATTFDFYVRSYCGTSEQSDGVKKSFTTATVTAPTAPQVTNAGTTTADFSWNAAAGVSGYQYVAALSGQEPDWNNAQNTTSTSVQLTSLLAGNTYVAYVRSYYSNNNCYSAAVASSAFDTQCEAKTIDADHTFTETFDAFHCWTMVDQAANTGWYQNNKFRFFYSTNPPQYLISPEFVTEDRQIMVEFDYWKHTSGTETFHLGYSTTTKEVSAFTFLEEVTVTNTSALTYSKNLPAGVKYVAIKYTANDQYYLYIDNFTVSEYVAPACATPTTLNNATDITPAGATFTWEGDADFFQYICVAGGTAETDIDWAAATKVAKAVAPAANQAVISGKAAGTYDFHVRSWCSDSEQSDALKKSFTTATIPAPTIGTITATNNSANASWTAPTGISYTVQYQWSINGTDWSEPTSETSAAISPLEQNTSYTFYVRSYYDATHIGSEVTKSFTTECNAITVSAVEYAETFDDINSGIPSCWNNNEGTTTNESYKWNSATGGQSGRCVRFESRYNGSDKTNVLASPLFTITADADLTFYVKNYKGGAYEVKISVDGGERQTLFTGLTNIQNWTKKEAALSDHIGKTVQFFFCGTSNWSENNNGYLYLDEFKITPVSCRKPASDPVVTSKDDTHATLTWTAGGANTDYQFALALKDEAPVWDAANVVTAFTKSFDDLTPLTWYDFYVRTYCDELNQSEARKVTFQTECASFVTLPFEQNFNSVAADAIPECWDNSEGTSTDYYKWKGYTYGGTHGTNCVRFNSSTNDADATNVLATPTIQLGEGNLLTFWAKNPTGGDFKVQIKEEGEEAVDLLTTGLTGLADWTLKYIAIPAGYNNKKVQILFHATSNDGDANAYIYIDDVRVARGEVFADTENNQARFSTLKTAGETIDVIFNRTLLCNGNYNTFCLPFSLSAAQIAESPIANFKLKAFDYAAIENEELLIAITNASSIEAGVPYFIANQSNEANQTVQLYQEVVISADAPSNKANSDVTFQGVFNPVDLAAQTTDVHNQLFLAAGNSIYWPAQNKTVKGFRAYFEVVVGSGALHIKAGMPARIVEHTDSATGIENTDVDTQALKLLENGNVVIIRNGVKYTIQGQKIQ